MVQMVRDMQQGKSMERRDKGCQVAECYLEGEALAIWLGLSEEEQDNFSRCEREADQCNEPYCVCVTGRVSPNKCYAQVNRYLFSCTT